MVFFSKHSIFSLLAGCLILSLEPTVAEECEGDVLHVRQVGVTNYTDAPITILSQNSMQVSFELSQTWLSDQEELQYLFIRFKNTTDVGTNICQALEEDTNSTWKSSPFTAICTKNSKIALVEVWASDPDFSVSEDIAEFPDCSCRPSSWLDDPQPMVKYMFMVQCVSACPTECLGPPSEMPSLIPSSTPSTAPSEMPSSLPSSTPSTAPSEMPSSLPSSTPSTAPSEMPSLLPSSTPSLDDPCIDTALNAVCKDFASTNNYFSVWGKTGVTFAGGEDTRIVGNIGTMDILTITGLSEILGNPEPQPWSGGTFGGISFDNVILNQVNQHPKFVSGSIVGTSFVGDLDINPVVSGLLVPGYYSRTEIGSLTFTPGTYVFDSAINIAAGTTVTLDAGGDPNAEFLFIAGSTFVTAAHTYFFLTNGAKAENIIWALGTAATLGEGSIVEGSILAKTAITFGTTSELRGCALAITAVTFETRGYVNVKKRIDSSSCPDPDECSVCQDFAAHARATITFSGQATVDGGDISVAPGPINTPGSTDDITAVGALTLIDAIELSRTASSDFAHYVMFDHADLRSRRSTETYWGVGAYEIGGQTFTPGVYRSASAINFMFGTTVTLNAEGNPDAKFLFQAGSTFVTAADTFFILIGQAQAKNVIWALGTAATLGAGSVVEGSIIAGTAITLGANAEVHGCAIAMTAITVGDFALINTTSSSECNNAPLPTSAPTTDAPTSTPTAPTTSAPTPSDATTSAPTTTSSSAPTSIDCGSTSTAHGVCTFGTQTYAVHGQSTVTFDGEISTVDGGDVGVYPGTSITTVQVLGHRNGNVTTANTVGITAAFQLHVVAAHTLAMATPAQDIDSLTPTIEMGGMTFTPGIHKFESAILISSNVILDGDGDYLFIAGTETLTTEAETVIVLLNGAKAEKILWVLGTAAILGARSVLEGSILAGSAITFGTQAELRGCALAQTAITFENHGTVNLNSQPSLLCTDDSLIESVCQDFVVHARTTVTFSVAGDEISGGNVGVYPNTALTSITGSQTWTDAVIAPIQLTESFAEDVVFSYSAMIAHQANSTYYSAAQKLIGSQTFTPGVHRFFTEIYLPSGQVFLDAEGDPDAKFLFQAGTTLITGANTVVVLQNGAQAKNVIWAVGSAVTLGAGSIIQGSLLAGTSITNAALSEVYGCELALAAITFPTQASVFLPDY